MPQFPTSHTLYILIKFFSDSFWLPHIILVLILAHCIYFSYLIRKKFTKALPYVFPVFHILCRIWLIFWHILLIDRFDSHNSNNFHWHPEVLRLCLHLYDKFMEKVAVMNENLELNRLAKENDNFKKIIQTQQNTINRMIDYFILGEKKPGLQK